MKHTMTQTHNDTQNDTHNDTHTMTHTRTQNLNTKTKDFAVFCMNTITDLIFGHLIK